MRDPAPWQKRYDMLLISALVMGIVGQYFFVDKPFGISVPIFVLGFYGLYFYAMKGRIGGFDKWRGQSKTGWLLFIPVALLALTYMFFSNAVFRVLNIPALMLLIVAQTMLLTRGGSQPWNRPAFYSELLYQWLIKPLTHLVVPFSLIGDRLRAGKSKSPEKGPWRRIALGLLIAAPIVMIILVLLGSADSIFMSWINAFPNMLAGHLGTGVQRTIAALLVALYIFCYVWGLMFPDKPKPKPEIGPDFGGIAQPPSERNAPVAVDGVTASTVLVCINAIYVLFAALQFSYLFGAAEGLLPDGIAYAEYARRGFAELVLVALLNIGLLLAGLHYIAPSGKGMDRFRRLLLTLLMLSSLVMLASAYGRLSLYEEAYGYTHLRLLVHGFMLMLGVWMTVALGRIWYGRFSLAKIYIAIGVAAYVTMNYINLDHRIAVNNIERYELSGKLDEWYLRSLSADAAPVLMSFLKEHPQFMEVNEAVKLMKWEASERTSWTSWNLSYQRLKN